MVPEFIAVIVRIILSSRIEVASLDFVGFLLSVVGLAISNPLYDAEEGGYFRAIWVATNPRPFCKGVRVGVCLPNIGPIGE